MMNHPSWKENADRLSSSWIDGHDNDAMPTDTPASPSPDDDEAQHYLADLLLVDSLLAQMSDSAVAERERRIREVMDALDPCVPPLRPSARFPRWPSWAAVAACLLIAITLSWIQVARQSLANEVLLAVDEVSSQATDRVYSIQRIFTASSDRDPPQGMLYLRGRSGFVISFGQVVLGRNADQFWLVGPGQQVTLSDDFHWIDARSTHDKLGLRFMQELSLESRHIPLMQLACVAELMRHDYDVELNHDQLDHRAVDLLVGRRRSARPELPVAIRLWADMESRVIQRAELSWEQGNSIILKLVPGERVPEAWYRYQSHCDGEPTVRRMAPKP